MTPAERVFWDAVRSRRLAGLRFRRQHPVGSFVLDFACPERRLAIELDGDIHDALIAQDAARTEILEAHGWRFIRFRNTEVLTDLPNVLTRIVAAAQGKATNVARERW